EPFTLWLLLAVVILKESLFRFVFQIGNRASSTAVRADDWAALFASGLIAWNGVRLLKPAIDELMDALPSEELQKEIARIALSCGGVHAVEKVLARKTGFTYWVDMHLEVPKDMTVEDAHEVAHRVKDKIRRQLPRITEVSIHVEPYPRKSADLTSTITA
ncbi:MAG: cation-efflux pump, partial [Acidimicrobiia bacterium]|nr:cation-efflux pump [Acidimicrobiia bacterium]